MQTLQHTVAHRGAGASRTNARWHPYTPPRSSGANTPNYAPLRCSSSQQIPSSSDCNQYLITPASTVYSISPACSTFAISPPRSSSSNSQIPPPKSINNQAPLVSKPQPAKANYVASLVDQAVKSLTDIWRPEFIPAVFATSTRISVAKPQNSQQIQPTQREIVTRRHSLQLPSPYSPTTQMSPLPPISEASRSSATSTLASQYLGEQYNNATIVSEKDLVPIRTFVHEVLRRSRTTCSVLQSALCYIEAIRQKVPELAEAEMEGKGVKGEPELGERITKMEDLSEDTLDFLTSSSSSEATITGGLQTELISAADSFDTNTVPTVLQSDATIASRDAPLPEADAADPLKRRKIPAKPLPPLPALPSPLLCPRRAFLAALILASKFLQDRCYSNRAWAKLSGLPPREVGRCERALGEALEWRLWVGKGASMSEESSRSVVRSKSESAIVFGGSTVSKGVSQTPSPPLSDAGSSPEFGKQSACAKLGTTRNLQSLRRAATLPDDLAFRSVPPRYRAPGSLPFAFNVGQAAAVGEPPQASFGTMGSTLARTTNTSFFGTEDTVSRWSYSPESTLDTPFTQLGNVWSPAPSTSSTDSSDSGSSIGSVATPPNVHTPYTSTRATYSHPYVDNGVSDFTKNMCGKDTGALEGVTTNSAPITSWYADVISAGVAAPIPAQEFGQLSMLDNLNSDFLSQQ